MRKLDIGTLKEFVRLNNRRLSPAITDCSDPAVYKEFSNAIWEIKEKHTCVKKFYYETINGDKEKARFKDISVSSFLLMCIPLLLATPTMGDKMLGGAFGAAVGYFLTLALMIVRTFLQGFASHNRVSPIGNALRIILLIVFGYFHVFGQTTFFGTTGIWVFAYVLCGTAITVLVRFFDKSRIEKSQRDYLDTQKNIDSISALNDKCIQLYDKLSDKATDDLQNFMKQKNIRLVPTKRKEWFSFDRTFDKHGSFILPYGNSVSVDFFQQFVAKTETSEKSKNFLVSSSRITSSDNIVRGDYSTTEKKTFSAWIDKDPCDEDFLRNFISENDMNIESKDSKITVETVINSQEFGWQDTSASEVEQLVSSGRIYPYFGMELPEFSSELKYRIFKHQFDVTVNTTYNNFYVFQQRYDSKEQIKFDADIAFTEALHNYDKIRSSNNSFWLEEKISQYEEMKEKAREDVGSVYVPVCKAHEYTITENKRGNEIGGILVFTPDGSIVAAYASDNQQSLDFIRTELKKYSSFVPNVYSQPFGYTQIQEMRRKYLN